MNMSNTTQHKPSQATNKLTEQKNDKTANKESGPVVGSGQNGEGEVRGVVGVDGVAEDADARDEVVLAELHRDPRLSVCVRVLMRVCVNGCV